jgi:hypothetical protein
MKQAQLTTGPAATSAYFTSYVNEGMHVLADYRAFCDRINFIFVDYLRPL